MPTETPPEFALSFTTEAVLLLRRQSGEWVKQAKADFDDPDLRNALNGLRARAEAASPGGFSTRLMIPDDQILYTTLEIDPDLPREQAVADALEGVTPYDVAELAFDWAETDQPNQLRVATLTRQTLNEAEEFARTHGFFPRGFSALPDAAVFPKEPDFSPKLSFATSPVADDHAAAPKAAEAEAAAVTEVDDWIAALGAENVDPMDEDSDEQAAAPSLDTPVAEVAAPSAVDAEDDKAAQSGDAGLAPEADTNTPAPEPHPVNILAAQSELPDLEPTAASVSKPEAVSHDSAPSVAESTGMTAPIISRITPHIAFPAPIITPAAPASAPKADRPAKPVSPVTADPGTPAPRVNSADIAAPVRDLPPVKPSVTERAAVLAERAGPLLSDLRRKSATAAATLSDRLSRMASGAPVEEKSAQPPLRRHNPRAADKLIAQPPLDERRATTLAERLSPHVVEPLRRTGKAVAAQAKPGKTRPEQAKLRMSPVLPDQMPKDQAEIPAAPAAIRADQPPLTVPPRAQAVLDRAAEARARRVTSTPEPRSKRRIGGEYRGLLGGIAAVLVGLVLIGLLIPSAPAPEPGTPPDQNLAAQTAANGTSPVDQSADNAQATTEAVSTTTEPAQVSLALEHSARPRTRPEWIAARLNAPAAPAETRQPDPPLPPSSGPAPVGTLTLPPPVAPLVSPPATVQAQEPAVSPPDQPVVAATAVATQSAQSTPPATPLPATPRPAPEPEAEIARAAPAAEPATVAVSTSATPPVARPTVSRPATARPAVPQPATDPRQANRAGAPAPDAAPVVPPSPQPFAQRDQTPLTGIRPRARPDDLAERIAAVVAAEQAAQRPAPAPVSTTVPAPAPTPAATTEPQPEAAPAHLDRSARPRPRPAPRAPAPATEAPLEEGAAAEPEEEAALTPVERLHLLVLQRDLRTAQAGGRAPTAEERELIRRFGARPARKPLNVNSASQEAVARAVGEALGETAATSASTAGLSRGNRPLPRPASILAKAGGGSGSGTALDSQAVDQAIASAIAESGASPGGVALTALESSPIPARRPTQIVPEPSMPPLPPPVIVAPVPPPPPIPDIPSTQPRQVAIAPAPPPPPSAVSRQVVVAPPLEVDDEPEPVKVSRGGATAAGIAKTATQKNQLDMGRTTLIGTFGTGRTSRALIRTSSGRFVKLKVGDQIEGGRVAEISTGKLTYVKGSRQHVMKILNER